MSIAADRTKPLDAFTEFDTEDLVEAVENRGLRVVRDDDAVDFERALDDPDTDVVASVKDGALTISAGALAYALTAVAAVVESPDSIPILGTVRITAKEGILAFTGTDLDNELMIDFLTAPGEEDFATCIAPQALRDVVRDLPADARVMLTAETGQCVVTFDGCRIILPALPVRDFPAFIGGDGRPGESVTTRTGPDFIRALDAVRAYISTEEIHYYLNGVCINADMGTPHVTATNGYHLAAWPMPVPEEFAKERFLIPTKAVDLARWLFRDKTFDISGQPRSKTIQFSTVGVTLRAKLIDGTFPQWPVVAKKALAGDAFCSVSREALLAAIRRALPYAPPRSRLLRVSQHDGRLRVAVRNEDAGDITIDVGPCTGKLFQGEAIGFHGGYMIDGLRAVAVETVTLRGKGHGDPVCFEGAENVIAIVMPQRV